MRYFTVSEAEESRARLQPTVRRLAEAWAVLLGRSDEVAARLAAHPEGDLGGGVLGEAAAASVEALEAIGRIQAEGVLIKDPATGLLDFPALRDGREVYLCWRLGEPRVAFWHPVEGGFAGRRPVDDRLTGSPPARSGG
jgi:hypothetical protein